MKITEQRLRRLVRNIQEQLERETIEDWPNPRALGHTEYGELPPYNATLAQRKVVDELADQLEIVKVVGVGGIVPAGWSHDDVRVIGNDGINIRIRKDGSVVWFKNGLIRREGDFPARTEGGNEYWYDDSSDVSQYHRDQGPAIKHRSGAERYAWRGRLTTKSGHTQLRNRANRKSNM